MHMRTLCSLLQKIVILQLVVMIQVGNEQIGKSSSIAGGCVVRVSVRLRFMLWFLADFLWLTASKNKIYQVKSITVYSIKCPVL